jgi:hypothetical protein
VHNGVTYELAFSFNPATLYFAFNKTNADSYQSALTYDTATGQYTGAESTVVHGAAVAGEWIAVKTDVIKTLGEVVISPTHLSMLVAQRSPRAFIVATFVDNAWVSVLQRTGFVDWTTESKRFAFDIYASSSEYRLIVSEVGNLTAGGDGQDRLHVSQIEFFEAPALVVTKLDVLEQRLADIAKVTGARVPPAPLQSALLEFGGVSYTASASVGAAYNSFNGSTATDWTAVAYDTTTGVYVGAESTTVSGAEVAGEWIQMSTSTARKLDMITIRPHSHVLFASKSSPREFTVAAFVDGQWTAVLYRANLMDWTVASRTFAFDTTVPASSYRLIITRVGNFASSTFQDRVILHDIEFFEVVPYVMSQMRVLEQCIADLIYKLYGVTNLEDAPE